MKFKKNLLFIHVTTWLFSVEGRQCCSFALCGKPEQMFHMQLRWAVNEKQMCELAVLHVCVFPWQGDEESKYFRDRTEVLRSPVISPWNVCVCVTGSRLILHVMAVGWESMISGCNTHEGPAAVSLGMWTAKYSPTGGLICWREKKEEDWGLWKWVLVVKHSHRMIYWIFTFFRLFSFPFFLNFQQTGSAYCMWMWSEDRISCECC